MCKKITMKKDREMGGHNVDPTLRNRKAWSIKNERKQRLHHYSKYLRLKKLCGDIKNTNFAIFQKKKVNKMFLISISNKSNFKEKHLFHSSKWIF